jgi:hypothetical protein
MRFQLSTLDEYSEENLIAELQRVAAICEQQNTRLTLDRFNFLSRAHSTTFRARFGSWTAALDRAQISVSTAPRSKTLRKDDLLEALKHFANENPNQPVTLEAFANRFGMYPTSITRRFGKWSEILAEVGLSPVALGRRYSDEKCYENILALWTHYGRQPRFGELKRFPSAVGSKAYIIRWGGWRSALSAFVRQVNLPTTVEETKLLAKKPVPAKPLSELLPAPRTLSLALRYRILKRDRFTCVGCGASPSKRPDVDLHVDHILAWSRGGLNTEENLRTLCANCNLGKGASLEELESL